MRRTPGAANFANDWIEALLVDYQDTPPKKLKAYGSDQLPLDELLRARCERQNSTPVKPKKQQHEKTNLTMVTYIPPDQRQPAPRTREEPRNAWTLGELPPIFNYRTYFAPSVVHESAMWGSPLILHEHKLVKRHADGTSDLEATLSAAAGICEAIALCRTWGPCRPGHAGD